MCLLTEWLWWSSCHDWFLESQQSTPREQRCLLGEHHSQGIITRWNKTPSLLSWLSWASEALTEHQPVFFEWKGRGEEQGGGCTESWPLAGEANSPWGCGATGCQSRYCHACNGKLQISECNGKCLNCGAEHTQHSAQSSQTHGLRHQHFSLTVCVTFKLNGKSLLKHFHPLLSAPAFTWKVPKAEGVCLKTLVCLSSLIANPHWAQVSAAGRFLFFPKKYWLLHLKKCAQPLIWSLSLVRNHFYWNLSMGDRLASSNVL